MLECQQWHGRKRFWLDKELDIIQLRKDLISKLTDELSLWSLQYVIKIYILLLHKCYKIQPTLLQSWYGSYFGWSYLLCSANALKIYFRYCHIYLLVCTGHYWSGSRAQAAPEYSFWRTVSERENMNCGTATGPNDKVKEHHGLTVILWMKQITQEKRKIKRKQK